MIPKKLSILIDGEFATERANASEKLTLLRHPHRPDSHSMKRNASDDVGALAIQRNHARSNKRREKSERQTRKQRKNK